MKSLRLKSLLTITIFTSPWVLFEALFCFNSPFYHPFCWHLAFGIWDLALSRYDLLANLTVEKLFWTPHKCDLMTMLLWKTKPFLNLKIYVLFVCADMWRTLSELGFASRQALIVVPRNQASQPHRGQLSMNMTTSNDNNRGYFDYVRRVLSYVNPFSYLSGTTSSSNSETVARTDGPWQYSKNPTYWFMLIQDARLYVHHGLFESPF